MINASQDPQYQGLKLKSFWHLAYYISSNRPAGSLAAEIINFKNNETRSVAAWAKWSADELRSTGIQFDYIIRALGSAELTATVNKPCGRLGKYLAGELGSVYAPTLLSKSRATQPLHTLGGPYGRFNELNGVYSANEIGIDLNHKSILIIDDVTTTSCTIAEIQRALLQKWPHVNLHLFCLGRTTYELTANDHISTQYFNK